MITFFKPRIADWKNYPPVFTRKLLNISINQSIEILRGTLELKYDGDSITIQDALVSLEWLPKPRISFKGNLSSFRADFIEGTIYLNLAYKLYTTIFLTPTH